MADGTETESRKLLRRLRDAMASDVAGQARLDKITNLIADSMGTEVCSVYLFRDEDTLELCASEGLKAEAVHHGHVDIRSLERDALVEHGAGFRLHDREDAIHDLVGGERFSLVSEAGALLQDDLFDRRVGPARLRPILVGVPARPGLAAMPAEFAEPVCDA